MSKADWMIWKEWEDDRWKIHVRCSKCGRELGDTEPLHDRCPECKSLMTTASFPAGDVLAMLYGKKEN